MIRGNQKQSEATDEARMRVRRQLLVQRRVQARHVGRGSSDLHLERRHAHATVHVRHRHAVPDEAGHQTQSDAISVHVRHRHAVPDEAGHQTQSDAISVHVRHRHAAPDEAGHQRPSDAISLGAAFLMRSTIRGTQSGHHQLPSERPSRGRVLAHKQPTYTTH